MESKTTMESPSKVQGMLLDFNQAGFNQVYNGASKIIPAIKALKDAYSLLDSETPFDNKQLYAFLHGSGVTDAINKFKESVTSDLGVFKNPLSKRETEHKIEQYSNEIYEPLNKLKQKISEFNSLGYYKLTANDFEITKNDVIVKTDAIERRFFDIPYH
jgi:hypothetical protein